MTGHTIDHDRLGSIAGTLVVKLDLWWLVEKPLFAVGAHDSENIPKGPTFVGHRELIAWRMLLVADPLDDSFAFETSEATREQAPVDVEPFLDFVETLSAHQQLTNNEGHPPVAKKVSGPRYRTRMIIESGSFHHVSVTPEDTSDKRSSTYTNSKVHFMDSLALARSMRGSIGMLAMHWLMAPSTNKKATAAGMPDGMAAYSIGRLGVLGDCPVDNVIGGAFFWNPGYLAEQVRAGRSVMSPADGAAIYVQICQEWGDDHLVGLDGVIRLGELAERVVASASPLGAPTFAGWRDQTLPEPGPGRTMQLCQTMRELGFNRFSTAVAASGMSPLEAIMSGPTGAWNAKMFGWPEPYPDCTSMEDARNEIEAQANRLHAVDFEVLSDDERDEFRELAKAARNHAGTLQTPESSMAPPKS